MIIIAGRVTYDFKCPVCHQTYTDGSHNQTHNDNEDFRCEGCNAELNVSRKVTRKYTCKEVK